MTAQRVVGWVLALVTTIVVVVNQRDLGIARDETVYMGAGSKYASWWTGLVTFDHGISKANITATWGGPKETDNNREHPPFAKTMFGLSEKLVHDKLGLAGEVTAYRLPNAVLHGALVWLVYAFALAVWGFAEAMVAALLVMFLPRALFHAGIACFDAPIMTMWFATVYAYWKCLDGRRWPWQVGVLFGLALATKHNALLLPFALGVHHAYVGFRAGRWKGIVTHRWRVLVSLAVLGPLTLVVVWPWLWFDTFAHVKDWITFHLKHVHYNFEYLGENWNAPPFPWHVALVTTLFTVPVATLAAAFTGLGVWIARARASIASPADAGRAAAPEAVRRVIDPRAPALLLVLSAGVSIGPFLLGSTPIFGAEKHWMPALPSFCIAAGVGAVWAARRAIEVIDARRTLPLRVQQIALVAITGLVVLAAAVETRVAQPYALTSYNALAGGAPGGADLGMNRQFWGYAARGVLPELPKLLPEGGPVYTHDAAGWGIYQQQGLLPRTFPDAGSEYRGGIERSRLALVIHERHFNRHDYLVWKAYGSVQPVFVLRSHGVPIVSVYRRR
ncbi:MAG TPA: glycosyltransferase family 39 protein [Kofleriaceae bacterium]|nr:glycosyltransferase family 39 protein [Kofleriaceae bacterium]